MTPQAIGTRRAGRLAVSIGALAAMVTVALTIAAAGSARPYAHPTSHTTKSASDTLDWGVPSTIATLNWIKGWGLNLPPALSLGMEGLLKQGPHGELLPNLATSWKQVTPTLLRYKLRHNVKFWNGTPFTAADVVASYGYLADVSTGSPLNAMFAAAKYVVARDKYTVDIRLKKPDIYFKIQPSQPAGWVTSKAFLEAHYGDLGTSSALLMGTGPYRVTSMVPGQSVTFTRNTNYWGAKPKYRQVVIHEIPDNTTRAIAVQSGQLDGATGVVPGTESQWQSQGTSTKFGADNFIDLLSLNMTTAPWSDIHVRRMVYAAIDRNAIIKSVLGGNVTPANWFAPPPTTGWGGLAPVATLQKAYKTFPSITFNMAKAKAELAQSSVPNGFNATVYYPDNHPENGALALSLAQNLKSIGVNLTVQKIPYPSWVGRAFSHKDLGLEFVYAGFSSYDPSSSMNSFLNSANAHANAFNLSNYLNSTVDGNIAILGDATKSSNARAAALVRVLKSVSTDLPWIPLWWGKIGIALTKGVGFTQPLDSQTFYTQAWANYVTKK